MPMLFSVSDTKIPGTKPLQIYSSELTASRLDAAT